MSQVARIRYAHAAVKFSFPRRASITYLGLQQLAQHGVEDAAVAVVVDLDESVDADGDGVGDAGRFALGAAAASSLGDQDRLTGAWATQRR